MAEVLITLGIIGVVAAMTMPTLIQNHKTKETVSRVKKAYSVISNAYLAAKNEHGEFSQWGLAKSTSATDEDGNSNWEDSSIEYADRLWDILVPHLNVISRCKSSDSQCEHYTQMFTLSGTPRVVDFSKYPIINLNDGTSFIGGWIHEECVDEDTSCADFGIDINGVKKGPNTLGKDIFYFYIYPNKIVPLGLENQTNRFSQYCKINVSDNRNNGYGCTAWVLYNENMDYLYCDDLSWSGKHKCK